MSSLSLSRGIELRITLRGTKALFDRVTLKQPFRERALSPDGRTLATGWFEKGIQIWDARTGTPRTPLKGHTKSIQYIAWSPNGCVDGLPSGQPRRSRRR